MPVNDRLQPVLSVIRHGAPSANKTIKAALRDGFDRFGVVANGGA